MASKSSPRRFLRLCAGAGPSFRRTAGYPGYELLRAWSFGGISALMPRSCSSGWRRRSSASALSSVLSGCSVSALPKGLSMRRLHDDPPGLAAADGRRRPRRLASAFFALGQHRKSMIRALLVETNGDSWTVGLLYQFPEASADSSEAKAAIRLCIGRGPELSSAHFCR